MEYQDFEDGFSEFSTFETNVLNENAFSNELISSETENWEPFSEANENLNDFISQQNSSHKTLNSCFCDEELVPKSVEFLEERILKSDSFNEIISTEHHPVKFKETLFYEFKIEEILNLLDISKLPDDWYTLISKTNFGCHRESFNFHRLHCANYESVTSTNKIDRSTIQTNGSHKNKIITTVNNNRSLQNISLTSSSCGNSSATSKSLLNGHDATSKSLFNGHDEKAPVALHHEHSTKCVEDLQILVANIEDKINSYSEQLLDELNLREKNKREKEVKNNFIASYIAVETKLNQYKRKKIKSSFFKYTDDSARNSPVSIPYFDEEGKGQSVEDLYALTKILQAIEKEDVEVSRLIAEYMINVGDKHDLKTIIQVRSQNGVVTPLQSPTKEKPSTHSNGSVER